MADEYETEDQVADNSPESLARAREAEHLVVTDMARYMSQFAKSFEASARRWELVVYPFLFAFIILAGYGFFLIYKLTNDVDQITGHMVVISENMVQMTETMGSMSESLVKVSSNMDHITTNMRDIRDEMTDQNIAMSAIVTNMEHMNTAIDSMSLTMYQMRYDTSTMGRNLKNTTGPMRFMNSFMPW